MSLELTGNLGGKQKNTDVTATNRTAIQLQMTPMMGLSLNGVSGVWSSTSTLRPRINRIATGSAYDTLRRMVQLEAYALKATVGPRNSRPKQRLKTKHKRIASRGTSSPFRMRPKLSDSISTICQVTACCNLHRWKYHAVISGHCVQEPTCTGDASHGAVDEADTEHDRQNHSSSSALSCLMNQFSDWHVCGG